MRPALLAAVLFVYPVLAPAALLDFEGFPVGTFLTTEYQASGIIFQQNARIHFLGANHATSGVLGLYNSGNTIIAEFQLPGGIPAVTNLVSVKGDLIPIPGSVTLQAFDINGNLIGSDVEQESPAAATLSFAAPGIHRVSLFAQTGTVAFDDLFFNTPVAADVEAVPEPSSLWLVACGAIALVSRRMFHS